MSAAHRSVRRAGADLWFGLVLAVAGVWIAWAAQALPAIPAQAYGPGFFPLWVGVGLAACGAWMALRAVAVRAAPADAGTPAPAGTPGLAPEQGLSPLRTRLAMAWVVIGLAIVAALIERVGFLVCVPVFMLGFLGLVGEPLWRSLLVTLSSTTVVYWGFAKLLKVPVPLGWLQGLV